MKIYSIEEIVNATNSFLDSDPKDEIKNKIKKTNKIIPPNIENIIQEAERALVLENQNDSNIELPLILKNEVSKNSKDDLVHYKIKIKPEIKDHMINELYTYLKKKLKKNTLKLILDSQIEIKNIKNEINFLKQKENNLKIKYQLLKQNNELFIEKNETLEKDKDNLLNNLEKVSIINEQLSTENKQLKVNLNNQKLNLEESLMKNRSFEINNSELKNTISRYIVNYKKIQEKVNTQENSKKSEFENENKKVKFYQDENIRLSSELLLTRKKNETIKLNFDNIELEKQKISKKIKELTDTITGRSNVISSPIIKEIPKEEQKEINNLDDKEQKSLDEVINRIFQKI